MIAKTTSRQGFTPLDLAAVDRQKFHDEQDDEPQKNGEADASQHGQDIDDHSRAEGINTGMGGIAQTALGDAVDFARKHGLDLTAGHATDDRKDDEKNKCHDVHGVLQVD